MAQANEKRNTLDKQPNLSEEQVRAAITRIAQSLVENSVEVKAGERVLVWYDEPLGEELAQKVWDRCIAVGAKPAFFKRNYTADAEL